MLTRFLLPRYRRSRPCRPSGGARAGGATAARAVDARI